MSLFEWMGESVNPGPMGGVGLGPDDRGKRLDPGVVFLRFLLALALLGGFFYAVLQFWPEPNWTHLLAGVFVYLGIAWLIRPQADTTNLGWGGGLIDDPFRYSDDWNRNLLFFSLVLLPGRIVTDGLWDLLRLVVGAGR
jgi:hypothetical protein